MLHTHYYTFLLSFLSVFFFKENDFALGELAPQFCFEDKKTHF
jgi:hypothetical protein